MAEKRFTASKKKLKKASKDGDRIKVPELNSLFLLLGLFLHLGYLSENIILFFETVYTQPKDFHTNIMLLSWSSAIWLICKTFFLFLIITPVVAIFSELLQLGFKLHWVGVKFSLAQLGVSKWWKRCFLTVENGFNFVFIKVVFKMLFCLLVFSFVFAHVFYLNTANFYPLDFSLNWQKVLLEIEKVFFQESLLCMSVFAAFLIYSAKFQRAKRLSMSLEELKKEFKEEEGDVHIRSMRKELHRQILFSGLVAGIKKAKVLVVGSSK